MDNFTKAKRNCAFLGALGIKFFKGKLVDWCMRKNRKCQEKGCEVVKIYGGKV